LQQGCVPWRRIEKRESDVNDGGNDKHIIDRQVQDQLWADTGDRGWWRSQRDGDNNNNNNEEGGSYPTPRTMATHELVVRLHSLAFRTCWRLPCPTWTKQTDNDDYKQWTAC
jgi:hypothetical protein